MSRVPSVAMDGRLLLHTRQQLPAVACLSRHGGFTLFRCKRLDRFFCRGRSQFLLHCFRFRRLTDLRSRFPRLSRLTTSPPDSDDVCSLCDGGSNPDHHHHHGIRPCRLFFQFMSKSTRGFLTTSASPTNHKSMAFFITKNGQVPCPASIDLVVIRIPTGGVMMQHIALQETPRTPLTTPAPPHPRSWTFGSFPVTLSLPFVSSVFFPSWDTM
ncbi:hypothetical protein B0T13DRAFT_163886 [Neurospora crassa]|nr:hypothetical protein B0T13DRAFT_163886 [Neurospora crassa]